MANDSLARGAKSAVFPSCSHVSQDKWDSIFGKNEELSGHDKARGQVATAAFNKTFKNSRKEKKNG